jgi:transposase-like protein
MRPDDDEVEEMYLSGKTVREIAERFGRSQSATRRQIQWIIELRNDDKYDYPPHSKEEAILLAKVDTEHGFWALHRAHTEAIIEAIKYWREVNEFNAQYWESVLEEHYQRSAKSRRKGKGVHR